MPKIDAYLRSIERFGASGALLASGQSITLRFPTGDRHATQVTPHELLVAMLREVAPPAAWSTLDSGRPARFELDSSGNRFAIAATPHPGAWQVAIEVLGAIEAGGAGTTTSSAAAVSSAGAAGGAVSSAGASSSSSAAARAGRAARAAEADRMSERVDELAASLAIERTPYDDAMAGAAGAGAAALTGGSGSFLLDQLLGWARARKASDLVLAAGSPAQARVDGRWIVAEEQAALDGELLARELGVLAPAAARAGWFERSEACFGADDAGGRVRVQLGRDSHGPRATIRLLLGEAPTAERLGLPEAARRWLRARRGLVALGGPPGSGKSTTLAALVRELGQAGSAVVTLEEPIELRHRQPLVSQRELGAHVPSVAAGVAAALREGADAIAIGRCASPEAAEAAVAAVAAGALVLVTVEAAGAAAALVYLAEHGGAAARHILADGVLGALGQQLGERADGGGRLASFEVLPGGAELAALMRERRWEQLSEIFSQQRAVGAISQRDATAELVRRGYLVAPPER